MAVSMAMSGKDCKETPVRADVRPARLPRYGIFGPTKPMKYGVSLADLKSNSDEGAVLEFCTDDMGENFDDAVALENKYFDCPDMMKCSYLMDELTTIADENDSLSTFEKMRAKMTNVTEDGGVWKALLGEGVGAVVTPESRVRVHYHAFLEDMVEPYDSSYLQGKELRITLGKGQVIPGLDLGIATMRKSEKARFLIESKYAYGSMGCSPRIPPNATILFEVELLGFTESSILDECSELPEERASLPFQKVLAVAKAEKNEGNDLFQQAQYTKAQRKFMRCVNALESVRLKDEKEESEMIKVVSKAYQNIALCALRLGNFGKALAAGKCVLDYDPNHPKALYISGKALRHISDFAEARRYMLRARRAAPSSKDITKELKLIDKAEEQFRSAEVDMCKKMFRGKLDVPQQKHPAPWNEPRGTSHGTSKSFQKVIKGRLEGFRADVSTIEFAVPISTFTEREVYFAADTAEEMGFNVELIDKPGKQKQLKISKKL